MFDLIKSLPDIILLSGRVKQAGKKVAVAGVKRYPAVALGGNYGNRAGTEIEARKEVWEAGVVASINIFDGGITSADIRRGKQIALFAGSLQEEINHVGC